jgi:hypothetical protein
MEPAPAAGGVEPLPVGQGVSVSLVGVVAVVGVAAAVRADTTEEPVSRLE